MYTVGPFTAGKFWCYPTLLRDRHRAGVEEKRHAALERTASTASDRPVCRILGAALRRRSGTCGPTAFAVGDWSSCGAGYLIARRPDNGELACHRGTNGAGQSPYPRERRPAVDDALGLVYLGSSTLFAVGQGDGVLAWSRSGGKSIGGEGLGIDANSGAVYGSVDSSGGPEPARCSGGLRRLGWRWGRRGLGRLPRGGRGRPDGRRRV